MATAVDSVFGGHRNADSPERNQPPANNSSTSTGDIEPTAASEAPAVENANVSINPRLSPDPELDDRLILINEIVKNFIFQCVSKADGPCAKFTMSVNINDKEIKGTGDTKELGKAAAAEAALPTLKNISRLDATSLMIVPNRIFESSGAPPLSMLQKALFQVFADHKASLVTKKFKALMERQKMRPGREVLAGIVMTTGPQMAGAKVIAVATGTKCITGEYLNEVGRALNDSHAEIIARRCLCDFMYSQLELHINPDTSQQSIFVPRPDSKGYRLKENIKFHLYVNTAPCGDGRISTVHKNVKKNYFVDEHPKRKLQGRLQTKTECCEGTIPVKTNIIQTWDGIVLGEPLLTMSCSDKIARWNVVGMQGSLLSHFVEPIYLESIVLGRFFFPIHIRRALYGRIETTIQGLPPPYRLNKPLMGCITSPEKWKPGNTPHYSVNWTTGREGLEIINPLTGKDDDRVTSRLSKRSFFTRFLYLLDKIGSITGFTHESCPRQYQDAKEAAQDYQTAKLQLICAFMEADLVRWVKKPIDQDQFRLHD